MLKRVVFLCSFLLSLLVSCTPQPKILSLVSDKSEMATAAALFDAANDDVHVLFHHVSSLDATLIKSLNPDIIVGDGLEAVEISSLLRPLPAQDTLYPTLENLVQTNPRLHPLAFQAPLIMANQETMAKIDDPSTITVEMMEELGANHTIRNRSGRLTRLGFNPTWNPDFLTDFMDMNAPTLFTQGLEQVNEQILNNLALNLRDWVIRAAGDFDSAVAFDTRYRYVPDDVLLKNQQILFSRVSLATWSNLPDQVRNTLDVRYLRGNRTIPITTLTSGGIPKGSKSSKFAQEFLNWLSLPATQQTLMERWERDGTPTFGMLGGLSAQPAINETILVEHVSWMAPLVPEPRFFALPAPRPHRWLRIRDELVQPWILSKIESPENQSTIAEAYKQWDLSSLNLSE
ncbi:MAG: hypothetical protein MI717_02065 [Spirochaetales bacterium]|nr:hypothetical protein [Spirochaetales bacterium]